MRAGWIGWLALSGVALVAGGVSPSSPSEQATLPVGDAWPACQAAQSGFDAARLAAAVDFARAHETSRPRDYSDQVRIFGRPLGPLPESRGGTNGLVLRHGCLVAEFGGRSRQSGPTRARASGVNQWR
jgi:hypothetical protein